MHFLNEMSKLFSVMTIYIYITDMFYTRNNPALQEINLVHAKDYANMSFNQLHNQLQSNREKDEAIQKAVQ